MRKIMIFLGVVLLSICLAACSKPSEEPTAASETEEAPDAVQTEEKVNVIDSIDLTGGEHITGFLTGGEEYQEKADADGLYIPSLPYINDTLDTDFNAIKAKLGYDLSGPGWGDLAESVLFLHNLDSVDGYIDNGIYPPDLYGAQNGEVIYYGSYGLYTYFSVKDLLPIEALTVEPAAYSLPDGKQTAFLFKLENGYLAITAANVLSTNWYDLPVGSFVAVKSLEYLSFIDYDPQAGLSDAEKVVDDFLNNPVQNGFAQDMSYLTKAAESDEVIYWHWAAGGGYGMITQSAVEPYTILSTKGRQTTTDQLLAFAICKEQGTFIFKDIECIGDETVIYHGDTVAGKHWVVTMEDGSSRDYTAVNAIINPMGVEIDTTAFFKNGEPWVYYDESFVLFN